MVLQFADSRKRGYLDFRDFQVFVRRLRRRQEVEIIMQKACGSSDNMPLEDFRTFLRDVQRSTLATDAIDRIYARFSDNVDEECGQSGHRTMTLEGFTSFLVSSDNLAVSERQMKVCDDMTLPLCNYYISSSHNVRVAIILSNLLS